jgi:hypothetical protein
MTATLATQDSRYSFVMPHTGQTALLFSPVHTGTVAKIKRVNSGYIVVTVEKAEGAFSGRCFGPFVGEVGTLFEKRDGSQWKGDFVNRIGERVDLGASSNLKAFICDLIDVLSRQGAEHGTW